MVATGVVVLALVVALVLVVELALVVLVLAVELALVLELAFVAALALVVAPALVAAGWWWVGFSQASTWWGGNKANIQVRHGERPLCTCSVVGDKISAQLNPVYVV